MILRYIIDVPASTKAAELLVGRCDKQTFGLNLVDYYR
jgi:hypothetical protein